MANYKKKTVQVADVVEDTTVEKTVVEEPVVEKKAEKKHFEQTDGVRVRSITNGLLNVVGQKTGIQYRWFDYGDETEMEYRDLVAEVRSRSASVFDPRFIIDDEDFIAEFPQVKSFYEEEYNIRDLQTILQMTPEKMRSAILELPKSVYPNLKNLVGTQMASGQLDSVKKIKILDEIFGTDLNFLTEMLQ